jgi:predicted metal-dependent TIM-barrel fold hydrolase
MKVTALVNESHYTKSLHYLMKVTALVHESYYTKSVSHVSHSFKSLSSTERATGSCHVLSAYVTVVCHKRTCEHSVCVSCALMYMSVCGKRAVYRVQVHAYAAGAYWTFRGPEQLTTLN